MASATDPVSVTAAFASFPEVVQVVGQGPHKCSVVVQLPTDGKPITLNADLLVVTDDQFPFAVLHFTGSKEHNIELRKGKGGQIVRSAGSGASLMAKDGDYAQVRLPSGEVRQVHLDCRATVGQVSNIDHANVSIGKAGRSRWLGRRPHNRGVTMNPVDHPMGGGEGRTSGGRHPCSPWGQLSKGLKTRNNKRTDGMIVKRRNQKG